MKTNIRKTTDPQFDADTIHVSILRNNDMRVYAYEGHDRVPVVQVDTDEGGAGRFKVRVNDGVIWDGDTATYDTMDAIADIRRIAADYGLAVSIVTPEDVLSLKGIDEPSPAQIAAVRESWEYRHYGDNWADWFEGFDAHQDGEE